MGEGALAPALKSSSLGPSRIEVVKEWGMSMRGFVIGQRNGVCGVSSGRTAKGALVALVAMIAGWGSAQAQSVVQTKGQFVDKFRQLEEVLPTPNTYRTGSGAPGHDYWQQRADHTINVEVDEETQRIIGSQTITYTNNSPDTLTYLWLLLDMNRFKPDSRFARTLTAPESARLSFYALRGEVARRRFEGGATIKAVTDERGGDLPYTVTDTLMRIDLPGPLAPGEKVTFSIDWDYPLHEQRVLGGRSGWEFFPRDGNRLFLLAQWFPRMAAYTDVEGWHNKHFLGRGEFTLEFGNYDVSITVPNDHVVASTGVLQNPNAVLTPTQRQRFDAAKTAARPIFIVTPDEALANEKTAPTGKSTWRFTAENVRDFAFATSRKFIWDAQGYQQNEGEAPIMAMSFYPNEAEPLWSKYSTESVVHTMEVYSRYTFDYPYPTAISVNGPVGGMEYPMITFNGPRPVTDEAGNITYTRRAKYGLISVIIHEIGHQYFPMIVNSDERQWTWIDEGINTFLQFLTEQEWEENYPSRRGDPRNIINYMRSDRQVPIMTNSESILQFGNNAYGKPATALNVLRETIMGRELFDFAFKEFSQRWQFRRPMPADLFRTMEDASGIDLDWFWRGWFYSTDHVDISIDNVRRARINTRNPDIESAADRRAFLAQPRSVTDQRNEGITRRTDRKPDLLDFYNENDRFTVSDLQRIMYQRMLQRLSGWERQLLESGQSFYFLDFTNHGGLVMPIILKIDYEDGGSEELHLPAEIWRFDPKRVSRLLITDKVIRSVTVDPHWETADVDVSNNVFPRRVAETRLETFRRRASRNLMREMSPKLQQTGFDGLPVDAYSGLDDQEILYLFDSLTGEASGSEVGEDDKLLIVPEPDL